MCVNNQRDKNAARKNCQQHVMPSVIYGGQGSFCLQCVVNIILFRTKGRDQGSSEPRAEIKVLWEGWVFRVLGCFQFNAVRVLFSACSPVNLQL